MKDKKQEKQKEKPKGKMCPQLSRMFYVDVSSKRSRNFSHQPIFPKYEIRTIVWHCDRGKCQWWIPETVAHEILEVADLHDDKTAVPALKVGVPIPPVELVPTGKGWCGKVGKVGPAS